MFSLLEMQGQSQLLHPTGSVELKTEYYTRKNPLWLVALKVLGVAVMGAVGVAIAVPTLLELEFSLLQSSAITAGGMLIYTGIAFFVRPEPNTDNMGYGGGLANDPFQYSDNINRILWKAHCVLGPGRFTAETLLDVCAVVGLAGGEEVVTGVPAADFPALGLPTGGNKFDATQPIAPLSANRFATSSASFVAGQIQLDSQRFFETAVKAN
jgi:hypothetical protein